MGKDKRFLRIIFILLSVILIVSIGPSCITIVHDGETEPSEQPGESTESNPAIAFFETIIEKIKGALSQPDSGPGQLLPEGQSTGPTRPHPPIRTGEISLGPKVNIASQSIGASGGTVAVSKPGDPLDGFVISVPPQSYADGRTFEVASAPITNQSFGSDINPISPMISVDNGGGYADEIMYVRVPVKVPEGNFAMGFIYDEKTGQLEGMPLVGMDAESVTVATMHFSDFFISMIEKALLKSDIDSGFRPGIDDWQFTNYGSYIAPGGHCEGQALTAMWYYCTQPDGKDLCLYGRYDNNGDHPATPDLWQDDSLGYRFCSVVQKEPKVRLSENFWENLGGKNWEWINNKWVLKDVEGIGDEGVYNLFVYSIRATGEPQEVGIWSNAGGGHAMVVYKVIGNALYIADPNYPGSADRKIIYYSGEGKFKPYNSGANRKEIDAGRGKAYESILYYGKSTIISWDTIAQRWSEFKNKTIGNDKFGGYDIVVVDDEGQDQPLVDEFEATDKLLKIAVRGNNFPAGWIVFRDGKRLAPDDKGRFELNPGENLLGVYIVGDTKNDPNNRNWAYVDFKYLTIIYEAWECKNPPPADLMSKLHNTTRFRCQLLNLPTNIEGHGSMNRWVPGFKFTKHFYVPGYSVQSDGDGAMPIKWSGTSFSGGGSKEYPDKLAGNVCYDNGNVLVSFDYQTNNPEDDLKISVKNLPIDPKYFMNPKYDTDDGKSQLQYMNSDATVVKNYVTRLEWKSHEEDERYGGEVVVWDASLISADWSNRCGFIVTFLE